MKAVRKEINNPIKRVSSTKQQHITTNDKTCPKIVVLDKKIPVNDSGLWRDIYTEFKVIPVVDPQAWRYDCP